MRYFDAGSDDTTQLFNARLSSYSEIGAQDRGFSGERRDTIAARVQDCTTCPWRSRCLSKSTASRRYLSVQVGTQPNLIDEMKAKIDTQQGKRIYARRLSIVEPVFANICVHKRMNRFTLRSKQKVDVQWGLFALVHNIGKIHLFGALT